MRAIGETINGRMTSPVSSPRHGGARGVDGDRHVLPPLGAKPRRQRTDHALRAPNLFGGIDALCTRARALAADIDDPRPRAHARLCMLDGLVAAPEPTIAEGIRRAVEDRHQEWRRIEPKVATAHHP